MLYRLSFVKIRQLWIAIILFVFASQTLAQEAKTIDVNQQNNSVKIDEVKKIRKNQSKTHEKASVDKHPKKPLEVILEQLSELLERPHHHPKVHR